MNPAIIVVLSLLPVMVLLATVVRRKRQRDRDQGTSPDDAGRKK